MQKVTVSHAEAGRRLDNYLIKALPGGGLSFVHKMLRKKNITVNGRKCEGNYRLAEGDEICMFFSDETYAKLIKGDRDPYDGNIKIYEKAFASLHGIEIVYEDDDFVFIDKPAGILSQQSTSTDLSANEWLVGYLLNKGVITTSSLKTFKPAFANRLDRNTSGLMLGGRSLKALQLLSEMLRGRELHKYYLCLAGGLPDEKLAVTEDGYSDIYAYLIKDRERNEVTVCPEGSEVKAKNAARIHTGFRLIRAYDEPETDPYMLLEVELYTGKSHQIRAQLAALGHPIIGDPKYGSGHTGQCLHAYRVVFPELPDWPAISGREFRTDGYKEEQYAEDFFGRR